MPSLKNYTFTSESVSEGHPDKVCDAVSDAILDTYLKEDPYSRVAVETMASTNFLAIAGEVRGSDKITHDILEDVARQTVKKIGYEQDGFHWKDLECVIKVHSQSPEIAMGVDSNDSKDEGAGDQGIMFGYACDETEAYMPAPIYYSHRLLQELAKDRHAGILDKFGPDAKSQFSIDYRDRKAVGSSAIVLSTQHDESLTQDDVRALIMPYIERILPEGWLCDEQNIYINPTGKFVIGGPDGDAGLTGRKIIVDTYGGSAPHGGGAFSGKDPTKVDRSAAYALRYLAKNVVAAGLAKECTLQVSYAIGISKPLSFYVMCNGTAKVEEKEIAKVLNELMDLSPRGIREHLQLNRPIYSCTSSYGHFGRNPRDDGSFSWEKTDLVDELKRHFGV